MSIQIRPYKNEDYNEVASWIVDMPQLSADLLSKSSTFILEMDSKLLFLLTVYFTNCKEICFLDNFIGNPKMKNERKEHSQLLFTYIEELAKDLGYKSVVCFSNIDKLTQKYETYGYNKLMKNACVLGKGI